VCVNDGVYVAVGRDVFVSVGGGVRVGVGVLVCVAVAVGVSVGVGEAVGVLVAGKVAVSVGGSVGDGVGGTGVLVEATTAILVAVGANTRTVLLEAAMIAAVTVAIAPIVAAMTMPEILLFVGVFSCCSAFSTGVATRCAVGAVSPCSRAITCSICRCLSAPT